MHFVLRREGLLPVFVGLGIRGMGGAAFEMWGRGLFKSLPATNRLLFGMRMGG